MSARNVGLSGNRYYKSAERRGKQMDMFPPGRVIFVRPLKTLVGRRGGERGPKRLVKGWDSVWISPEELIAEGILISGKVYRFHCAIYSPCCMLCFMQSRGCLLLEAGSLLDNLRRAWCD